MWETLVARIQQYRGLILITLSGALFGVILGVSERIAAQ